jgi:uncharacterized protein YgiM (DUF1202 family)
VVGSLFLAAGPATAFAQEASTATATVRLNVRSGPGLDQAIVKTIESGTAVEFTGFRNDAGDWIQVRLDDGTTGWVAARFLSSTPAMDSLQLWQATTTAETSQTAGDGETAEAAFSDAVVTATTSGRLNLRELPFVGSTILTTLDREAVVGFTGFKDWTGEWVQVDDGHGTVGWVMGRYLSSLPAGLQVRPDDVPEAPAANQAEQFADNVVTAQTLANLNVRSGPGLDFEVVHVAPLGTVVGFTGFRDASSQWVQVDVAGGPVGWVSARFLSRIPANMQIANIAAPAGATTGTDSGGSGGSGG